MESHHQSMSRLIAKWHYQQEKGLTWKEWAKGILNRQSIEGARLEGTDLSRWESRCPEPTILGWHPPVPEDVLIPPVDSASSESLEEEPQWIPNYSSTQGNQHLLTAQLSAPVSRTPTLEDQQAEEQRRAMQAVKDITTGQPTSTLKENQMYDWDGQLNDTLGLPIQLRNWVSNQGTPPVRASPRAPGYGGGAGGATVNIGSGPGLYMVTEDTKGNSMGEAKELPPQQREDRMVPPTLQPRSWKTQTTESTVGQTSPQEVCCQAYLVPSEGGPGTVASADPVDIGTRREPLKPTPYGPPRTDDVQPQCLDFSMNTSIYPVPCQICGSPDHQTNYCQGGWQRESEDPSLPSSGEEEASRRRCPNCMNEHLGGCPCRWCNQLGHISSQCTDRHDSDVMRQRSPKRVTRRNPPSAGINAGNVPSTTPSRSTVLTYRIHNLVWVNVKHADA